MALYNTMQNDIDDYDFLIDEFDKLAKLAKEGPTRVVPGDLARFITNVQDSWFYGRSLSEMAVVGSFKELAFVIAITNERYTAAKVKMVLVMLTPSGKIGWVSEAVLRNVKDDA